MGAKKRAKRKAELQSLRDLAELRAQDLVDFSHLNATQAETIGELQKELAALRHAHANQVETIEDLQSQVTTAEQEAEATGVALDRTREDLYSLHKALTAECQETLALRNKLVAAQQEVVGLTAENELVKRVVNLNAQECEALLKKLEEERADHERVLHKEGRASLNAACRLSTARALIANLHEQLEAKTHYVRAVRIAWAKDIFESERSVEMLGNSLLLAHEEIAQLGGDEK